MGRHCGNRSQIACSGETLHNWIHQSEHDAGQRAGLSTEEQRCLKEQERKNGELKRANEILRKA